MFLQYSKTVQLYWYDKTRTRLAFIRSYVYDSFSNLIGVGNAVFFRNRVWESLNLFHLECRRLSALYSLQVFSPCFCRKQIIVLLVERSVCLRHLYPSRLFRYSSSDFNAFASFFSLKRSTPILSKLQICSKYTVF